MFYNLLAGIGACSEIWWFFFCAHSFLGKWYGFPLAITPMLFFAAIAAGIILRQR